MLLRPGEKYPDEEITILFNQGGIGDHIARLPAVRYIEDVYPQVKVHLYCPAFLHELFSLVLKRTILKPYPPEKEDKERPGYYFGKDFHTTLGTHLTDHAFSTFCDQGAVDLCYKQYPTLPTLNHSFTINEPYVVLTPGFTSRAREMLPDVLNALIRGVRTRGVLPVCIGRRENANHAEATFKEGIDYESTLDLRDQTSIVEAAAVIQGAKAVIGLDNGMIHLAGMTNTPIIVGYSSQLPKLRLPYRGGVLGGGCHVVQPDTCMGCEPKLRFYYKHDFKYCHFGDYVCLKELSAEKYLAKLDEVLRGSA